MRTHKKFMQEMIEAHDCEKCHGKIFVLTHDVFGRTCCGYCNETVNYPSPTQEEFVRWIEKASKTPGIQELIKRVRERFGIEEIGEERTEK